MRVVADIMKPMLRMLAVVGVGSLALLGCSGFGTVSTSSTVDTATTAAVTTAPTSVSSPTTLTTVLSSTVATTSTTVPLPDPIDGWRSTGSDPGVFGSVTITDAVVIDERIIAVGCTTTGGTGAGFPVWVSEDAATWEQATGPATVGPISADCLTDVVTTPIGVFAHGLSLFRSTDGLSWEPVEFLTPEGSVGNVEAIFPTAGRVSVLLQRGSLNETTIATLFTTIDGTTWVEGPAESAALFDSSGVGDVLGGGERLIAVGASPWGEFVPTAAVWTSTDGLNWELVTPRRVGFSDAYMHTIIDTGDQFVAVGGNPFDTGLMAALASPDGIKWRRLPPPDEQANPNVAYMEAVAITQIDGTIYAAGRDYDARRSDGLQELAALWVSSDGATWERITPEELPGLIPFSIVNIDDSLIGFWPPPGWPDRAPVQVFTSDR